MAHYLTAITVSLTLPCTTLSLVTCPGFPGYCSESFPGHTCNVVCEAGRNNVPLCQADGTWTDIPRCIEHDPGVEHQVPGLCPSIPGYCAQNFLNSVCQFNCTIGQDIYSVCTADGTWNPYPTCQGDIRETRDGCDGCPGPLGGRRNRTAETILGLNRNSGNRVPKIVRNDGKRKLVPSFAGDINIGPITLDNNRIRTTGTKSDRRPPTVGLGRKHQRPESALGNTIVKQQTRTFHQIQPPQSFGVFEAVKLGASKDENNINKSTFGPVINAGIQQQTGDFFGEFESVNL